MNICLVTRELSSIPGSGGIGTATENLAKAFSQYGIKVDILFTTWLADNDFILYKNKFLKYNINLYTFDHFFTENIEPFEARIPQCVFNFFKNTEKLYDFIIFHEYMYDGYYVLNFNKSIDNLKNTKLWIITHSPMQWCFEANKTFIYDKKNILNFDLEKSCVENADLLTSPSEYMLNWINSRGYKIPDVNKVIPNIIVDINEKMNNKSKIIKNDINEIIFFGRLEDRKGLGIFIDALNILPYEITKKYKITFLGRECHNNTADTIIPRIKSIFKKISFKTNYKSKEAIEYLKKSQCLCIMPSFIENSPCTVLECLYYGIPFITSETGGQKELIEEKYREYSTFKPDYKSLCKKIIDILSQDNIIIPSAQYTPKEIFDKYIHLIKSNNNNNNNNNNIKIHKDIENPLISIIITTYNRPKLLAQAITSAINQTYKNIEIIVVDDGSTDDITKNMCNSLEKQHKIRYIKQNNKYLGAARNNGIKNAYGEYIVLLDDDNFLYSNFIEETYRVILNEKADCVTTGMQYFYSQDNPPTISDFTNKSFIFFGGRKKYSEPYISSLFYNIYGDATALYKKVIFNDVHFHEHYGVTHEDWALHQSLQIKGYKIVTIPEPLLFYRVTPDSMIRTTKKYDNFMAQLEPIKFLNSNYYDNLLILLQYFNIEKSNNELPTIEDILNGKYENCDDKVLLDFYKFTARIGIKLGKLFKNKKTRYIITKIVQK